MGREWGFDAALHQGGGDLFVIDIGSRVVFVILGLVYIVFIRVGDLAVIITFFLSLALRVAIAFIVIVEFRDDSCGL